MNEAEISAHNAALTARFGEKVAAMHAEDVPDPRTVEIMRDIKYSEPGGIELLLDLYRPAHRSGPLPVIIWLHGGAWMVGDRSFSPDLSRHYAERGYAMVNIEYRLSGQANFPAALEDVRAAVRWVRANASQYGLDGGAVGIWGSSAGAHLGTLAAVTARTDEDRVQVVVDGYGPTDLALADEQSLQGGQIHDAVDSPNTLFLGTQLGKCPQELLDAVNPVKHVTSDAPPFLILHGTHDLLVPPGQSKILHEALTVAGVESTLCLVDGADHGFFNGRTLDHRPGPEMEVRTNVAGATQDMQATGLSFELIERFFDRHLRHDPWAA